MRFTKMQGCGNDYIYINCFKEKVENPEKLAIAMSERHFGVGSDGLVLIMPSEAADFRMRMFNLDGSEGKMCGNASRCVGKICLRKRTDGENNGGTGNIGRHQDFAAACKGWHCGKRNCGHG